MNEEEERERLEEEIALAIETQNYQLGLELCDELESYVGTRNQWVLFMKGVIYYLLDDNVKALKFFYDTVVLDEGKDVSTMSTIASLYDKMDLMEDAYVFSKWVVSIDDTNVSYLLNHVVYLLKLSLNKEAKKYLKKAKKYLNKENNSMTNKEKKDHDERISFLEHLLFQAEAKKKDVLNKQLEFKLFVGLNYSNFYLKNETFCQKHVRKMIKRVSKKTSKKLKGGLAFRSNFAIADNFVQLHDKYNLGIKGFTLNKPTKKRFKKLIKKIEKEIIKNRKATTL